MNYFIGFILGLIAAKVYDYYMRRKFGGGI